MLQTRENTLQITSISQAAIQQLSPSFSKLPNTEHADGQYRLRRYSVVKYQDGKVDDVNRQHFIQSDKINSFQGNVVREFDALLPSTIASQGMRELCQLFVDSNQLPDGQEIEIHQIRVSAVYDETQVAPEGVHQDGFDHIAIIGIDRHNIVGGEIMLYQDSDAAPFFRKVLENGEVTLLADSKLWHNASPIRSVDSKKNGYMDLFVLTAKENSNDLHS